MKRWATCWFLWAALTAGALLDGPERASAYPPELEHDSPVPMVIDQWQQVGAVFGWITIDPQGEWRFHREKPAADWRDIDWPWDRKNNWRFLGEEPGTGALPAFRFNRFPAGNVSTLAAPELPFGLWLGSSTKDTDLKELAGLNQLQALNIEGNYAFGVTDAGLERE